MPYALIARSLLLAVADNEAVKRTFVGNDLSRNVVRRFVAGETLDDAIATGRRLQGANITSALDRLGENVTTVHEAQEATDAYIRTLDALAHSHLPSPYVSVKLTALGLALGDEVAAQNLDCILVAASSIKDAFVRVDMEGSVYTQRTLDLVRAGFAEFGNVGTVLQSYLRRTDNDLQQLLSDGIRVRLVKGAYAEPSSVAYPDKADVNRAYARQMQELLLHGKRPAIATHDESLIHEAKRFVREHRIPNDRFEFQMLLGVQRDLQKGLAEEGYHVRAYVPFGAAWYPYFTRRLAERPANVGFVLRNLLKH